MNIQHKTYVHYITTYAYVCIHLDTYLYACIHICIHIWYQCVSLRKGPRCWPGDVGAPSWNNTGNTDLWLPLRSSKKLLVCCFGAVGVLVVVRQAAWKHGASQKGQSHTLGPTQAQGFLLWHGTVISRPYPGCTGPDLCRAGVTKHSSLY